MKNNAKANRSNPTEAENALWQALRAKQLGEKFRRQHIICDCIADFVSLKSKLIIEVDGNFEGLNEHFFRIATQTPEENDKLVESIKKWTYMY